MANRDLIENIKDLVDSLIMLLDYMSKKYLATDKSDTNYNYYHETINEGSIALIITATTLYENNAITVRERELLIEIANNTLSLLR